MNLSLLGRIAVVSALLLGWDNTRAHAATFSVSNLNDSGSGSLRQAIASANTKADADTILFASSLNGTLTLETGALTISRNLTIVGPGADVLTLIGNGKSRLFTITGDTVALSGLTLSNGLVKGKDGLNDSTTAWVPPRNPGTSGEDASGGAIFNQGLLTLTRCSLRNNTAEGGKGGRGRMGTMISAGSGLPGGVARGGAIFSTGTLNLVDTQFESNTAQGGSGGTGGAPGMNFSTGGRGGSGGAAYGGAVYSTSPPLVENSTWLNNRAVGGVGGAGGVNRPYGAAGTAFNKDIYDGILRVQDAIFSGMVRIAFQAQLPASGEVATYSLVSGKLPAGLSFDAGTGAITGTPTKAVVDQRITFKVSNQFVESNVATVTFNIQPYTPETPSLIVTTLTDTVNPMDKLTSLREAIAYAHTLTGSPAVRFQEGLQGTLSLKGGALVLTHDLSIAGPVNNAIVLDGTLQDRIFYVQKGVANICNLSLTRGTASAILNESEAKLNLSNSTLFQNSGSGGGGGLFNKVGGMVTISNCTFTNNTDVGNAFGGALYNGGKLTVESSTIVGNFCRSGRGGGICNDGTLTLRNSIVAGNTASQGPDVYGQVQNGDYNLVQTPSGATLSGPHNITDKDPNLGPLQNSVGPTPTMALFVNSPALDAGQTTLKTDQRGLARPAGRAADIGAYEGQSTLPIVRVNSPSVKEGNGGPDESRAQLVFTLSLSKASTQKLTLFVETTNATTSPATAKFDYVQRGKTAIVFAPGQTSQSVAIPIIGDTVYEDSERVALLLSSPVGVQWASKTAEGTIVNDDTVPSISINNVSISEGNRNTSKATFTVTLSNASDRQITVGYATQSRGLGAALGGTTTTLNADYITTSGTLVFEPGQTSKSLTVFIKGDTAVEGDEPFLVRLLAPINARIQGGASIGTGTIQNDDSAAPASNSNLSPSSDSGGNS